MAKEDPDKPAPDEARALRPRIWASEASQQFSRLHPDMSARSGLSGRQVVGLAVALLLLIAGLSGLIPGLKPALLLLAGLFFTTTILLRVLALIMPAAHGKAVTGERLATLPRVTIIVAAYDEARVMAELLKRLMDLDYPDDRLQLILALEEHDTATINAARACEVTRQVTILATPPGEPRTKPRALNFALRHSRGEIIAVYDAEDRPSPDQVMTAALTFQQAGPDLACLQAPLNWYNRDKNWLTRQFALEYAAHFRVMLPFFVRLGWPLPLGGTSNYFRAEALRRVGGWDAHNVTEDADLGFRLHRAGYRCDLIAPPTLEEAPFRVRPWFLQRTRWIKGYIQTFAVHSRKTTGATRPPHWIALSLTLGAAIAAALLHLPFAALSTLALTQEPGALRDLWPYYLFAVTGYAVAAATAWLGMRRMGWTARLFDLLTMPLYWPLLTPSAVRALWQLAFNPYFWDKTEHGLTDEN
ncbi:glycosyltransferase family 2 protein [Maricaulis sp. MIT060901]|uniref:glycosyltransferase family 2 protein n=1 Tax=Maricaulis sp. MIT060901 TaxID=3096993 RepID=UPI00399C18EE